MSAIDRYVVRTTLLSFLIILISLTGIIWITQALRGFDLMTNQGQTILVFLGVTGLAIPLLAMVIAPIALHIAIMYTLNSFAADSEIIAMYATGLKPARLLRPFLISTLVVSLFVAFLSLYLSPQCLRSLKQWQAEIGADVLVNILQPGEFSKLGAVTLRVRERLPDRSLQGIFIDDQRNPSERVDIIAERGAVQKNDHGSFLILQDGNFQRHEIGKRDATIVSFKSYAFDLSQFATTSQNITYGAREKLTGELISPSPDDPIVKSNPNALWAELHDRLLAPIYPFVFAIIAFAVLGSPRTTRQTRKFAIILLIIVLLVVRIAGFGFSTVAASAPQAIFAQYFMLVAVCAIGFWMIARGVVVDRPRILQSMIDNFRSRLAGTRPI